MLFRVASGKLRFANMDSSCAFLPEVGLHLLQEIVANASADDAPVIKLQLERATHEAATDESPAVDAISFLLFNRFQKSRKTCCLTWRKRSSPQSATGTPTERDVSFVALDDVGQGCEVARRARSCLGVSK